jgi:tetratricopeptide (TPR) repeat protein
MTLLAAGRLDEATSAFEEALEAASEVGFPPTVFASLGGLATVAALRSDLDTAERCASEALTIATEVGLWAHVVNARSVLVGCAIENGRLDDAEHHAEAAVSAAALLGDPRHHARARLALARVLAAASSVEARGRASDELRRVAADWERHGVVPSAIERAEFDDAERRCASGS